MRWDVVVRIGDERRKRDDPPRIPAEQLIGRREIALPCRHRRVVPDDEENPPPCPRGHDRKGQRGSGTGQTRDADALVGARQRALDRAVRRSRDDGGRERGRRAHGDSAAAFSGLYRPRRNRHRTRSTSRIMLIGSPTRETFEPSAFLHTTGTSATASPNRSQRNNSSTSNAK